MLFISCQPPTSAAHFSWKYNTEISPNPCSVPLNNSQKTSKGRIILNISLSFFLYTLVQTRSMIHAPIKSQSRPLVLFGHRALPQDVFSLEKMFQHQWQMTWFIFITTELLRLIACVIANTWPSEPGWVVYVILFPIWTLLYSGNLLKS